MYYICNQPEPIYAPDGNVKLYGSESAAIADANRMAAERPSNLNWYVHRFPPSEVIFRAKSVITVDSEYLNGTADQG